MHKAAGAAEPTEPGSARPPPLAGASLHWARPTSAPPGPLPPTARGPAETSRRSRPQAGATGMANCTLRALKSSLRPQRSPEHSGPPLFTAPAMRTPRAPTSILRLETGATALRGPVRATAVVMAVWTGCTSGDPKRASAPDLTTAPATDSASPASDPVDADGDGHSPPSDCDDADASCPPASQQPSVRRASTSAAAAWPGTVPPRPCTVPTHCKTSSLRSTSPPAKHATSTKPTYRSAALASSTIEPRACSSLQAEQPSTWSIPPQVTPSRSGISAPGTWTTSRGTRPARRRATMVDAGKPSHIRCVMGSPFIMPAMRPGIGWPGAIRRPRHTTHSPQLTCSSNGAVDLALASSPGLKAFLQKHDTPATHPELSGRHAPS